jgi:hypothetical protein
MINYLADPAILRPYVPPGTELDSWNGKTLISMVGFLFLRTRVLGLPIPWHTDFEEVNLRFYVRRRGPEGWRRGVVFIKELVPKPAIALVAQTLYHENYVAVSMGHILQRSNLPQLPQVTAAYRWWGDKRWNGLQVVSHGEVQPIIDGSEEEFIAEHYWGYAAQPDGGCVEYGVEHPRWRVWQVSHSHLDCDAAYLYGPEFADPLRQPPSSAFLAEGSAVVVRQGVRI